MSEPTYRVELTHHPEYLVPWRSGLVRISDDFEVGWDWGATREEAFDKAQDQARRRAHPSEQSSTVYLDEDGNLLDRHEAGVLRDANA